MPITRRIIDERGATTLLEIVLQEAVTDGGKKIAVAVGDPFGNLICAHRQDGCKIPSMETAINKMRTAGLWERHTVEFHHEQHETWVKVKDRWEPFDAHTAATVAPFFNSWAGGLVIVERWSEDTPTDFEPEVIIGALGISGREETEDHDLGVLSIQSWAQHYRLDVVI